MSWSPDSRGRLASLAGILAIALTAVFLFSGCSRSDAGPTVDPVARGEYLVRNVAMCADCHTPRLADGSFDESSWLMGGELDFTPRFPIPGWADVAPAIAGLPGWSEHEAVTLLSEGELPEAGPLAPPMPQYRMNREDAEAVVAYLKSLATR